MTPGGALQVIYYFCSDMNAQGSCVDGRQPMGPLIQGKDGALYGTTFIGGASAASAGVVYRITLGRELTTLGSTQE